jgi:hypothetical protein
MPSSYQAVYFLFQGMYISIRKFLKRLYCDIIRKIVIMTIGIAICLEDEILLFADGRHLDAYREDEPVKTDTANKIVRLSTSDQVGIALISFGVTHVTNLAIHILEQLLPLTNFHLGSTPEDICRIIDSAISGAWTAITPCFASNIDLTRNDHVAAFVIGGYVLKTPFVGVTIRTHERGIGFQYSTKTDVNIVLSQDKERSRQIFLKNRSLEPALSGIIAATKSEIREAYKRSAVKTIREVASSDQSVGGTIRYSIMTTESNQYIEGVCPD